MFVFPFFAVQEETFSLLRFSFSLSDINCIKLRGFLCILPIEFNGAVLGKGFFFYQDNPLRFTDLDFSHSMCFILFNSNSPFQVC